MTHVKICSVSETEHIRAAAEAGAGFVGLNFVPGVRRRLNEEKARRMVRAYRALWGSEGPKLVGIFVDQPADEVNRIVGECDLDIAQLSGDETIEYCQRIEWPVIKAIHVPTGESPERAVELLDGALSELEDIGAWPLLDPRVDGHYGGAGVGFDWSVARELASRHALVLAGGLTPDNIAGAVRQVQPWGVDVSSGVETGGIKDVAKIRAFARAVRGVDC